MAKFKGGYSLDASLVFQSWLKDIQVYTIEHHLSQREAIQLVKDYTSEQARSEVEYYLGLTPSKSSHFRDWSTIWASLFNLARLSAPWLLTFITGARGPGKLKMPLQTNCKSWSGRSLQGNRNLSMRPTRHWNISLPRIWETHISEWWPGDSVCLPLTPRVSPNLGVGWPLCSIAGENNMWGQMLPLQLWKVGTQNICPAIPGRGRTKSMPKQLRLPKWRLSWTRLCKRINNWKACSVQIK